MKENSWKHDFFWVIFHGMQSSCKGGDSVKLQRKVTLLPGVRGERLALSSLCFLDIVEGFLLCLFSTEISFTALKSQDSIRQMLKFSWCGSFESIGFGDSSLTILQCLHFWIKSRVWAGNVCQTNHLYERISENLLHSGDLWRDKLRGEQQLQCVQSKLAFCLFYCSIQMF